MSSVKKSYEAVIDHLTIPEHKWWYNLLWHWHLPPKLKVFGWLVLKNRILTGKNLIKRGLFGPFVCAKCKSDEETVNHLFITCPFAQGIWSNIFWGLNIPSIGPFASMEDIIHKWHWSKKAALPIFTSWSLWRNNNSLVFEGKGDSKKHFSYKIIAFLLEYTELNDRRKVRYLCIIYLCFVFINLFILSIVCMQYKGLIFLGLSLLWKFLFYL